MSDTEMRKTIKVSEETWAALMKMKIDSHAHDVNEVIQGMLKAGLRD